MRARWLWVAALLLFPLPLAAGTGLQLMGGSGSLVNVYQGVLQAGETDTYPNELSGLTWPCFFALGGISQLYLVVEDPLAAGRVVLWTWERDAYGRGAHVPHPAEGVPPRASARTGAAHFGCPNFEVEARDVVAPVAYTAVACHAVGACPDALP